MSSVSTPLPRIALSTGDPAGIGPEIVTACLADAELARAVRLLVVGPRAVRPAGLPDADPRGSAADAPAGHAWLDSEGPERWDMGRAQAACGHAALTALRTAFDLTRAGVADALVTAPVCKEALHLAGEPVEGQTELLTRWDGEPDCEMVGISGDLRVMLTTRHMPLRAALDAITTERVLARLELFDRSLRSIGVARPRLALAGLNPHAGEGGILGREDGELLAPAVERARALGLDVDGPRPPDTVFLEASRGLWDGVLALYHDQAFIPLKLLGQGHGLTWIAGLSVLRLSPVHGTAFDIAGKGLADPTNLRHALRMAGSWVDPGSRR